MKPGYQTTEFWLTLVAHLVGAFTAAGFVTTGPVVQVVAFIAMVLAQLGYTSTRAWVKTTETVTAANLKALASGPKS